MRHCHVGLSEGILAQSRRIFHEPMLQGRKAFYPTRLQTNVAMWLSTAKLTVPVPFAPFAAVAKIEGSMSFEELWPEYEAKMKAGGKESASDAAISAFKYNFKAPPGKG